MRLKNNLKYIVTPAEIFTTALILLLALLIVQGIIISTEDIFTRTKYTPATMKPEAELTQEEKRISRIRNSAKEFLPDRTIHLVYAPKRTPGQVDGSEMVQIYDINDNPLWEGPRNRKPYEYLSWSEQLREYRVGFTQQRMKQLQMITPEFSRTLEIPVQSEEKTIQIWRYNLAKDYLAGYDNEGNKIGYIGSTGFTGSKSNAKPFGEFKSFTAWCPQDSFSPTLLWQTQRRIYQIEFEKQTTELIFESTDSDIERLSLHGWRDLASGTKEHRDSAKYRPLLQCETEDGKNHLIMRDPEQRLTITVPEDWKNWVRNYCQFTATKEAIFMRRSWIESRHPPEYSKSPELFQQWLRNFRSQPQKHWVELYMVDNQGGLKLLNHYNWTVPALSERVVEARDFRLPAKRSVSKLSPPLYDLAWHLMSREFWVSAFQGNDLSRDFQQMLAEVRPGNSTINWLLSAMMIGFTFWHGWPRRTSWPKFLFWLAFAGIFNLAGLLTYLALNHTTVIKCTACSRSRGLTKVNCTRCGVELPTPKRGKLDLIFNS